MMAIDRRKGVALGVAAVVAAGSVWLGTSGASAEDADLRGWPGGVSAPASQVDRLAAAPADARAGSFAVRTRTVRDAFVDVGMEGESAGDFILFEERVFSSQGDREIGRDAVRCELGLRTFTCEATVRINGKGKIRAAGTLFGPRDNVIPVTGGTGAYRGAGGAVRVFDLAGGDSLLVFNLTR